MNYEPLITHLKNVRENAGISQRELSRRTGITQSHISLVERGSVDPGLPSIIQWARALDLELMLVPKKLVPAVTGIVQGNEVVDVSSAEHGANVLKVLRRGIREVRKLIALYGEQPDLARIESVLNDMRRLNIGRGELLDIANALDELKRYQASPQAAEDVRRIANTLRTIRNGIVHPPAEAPRPAYGAEDEEDDDA